MQQAVDLIKSNSDILILTHKNPDGDAVGSILALATALKSLGKKVRCFSHDNIPEIFNSLPSISIIQNQIESNRYDLIVLLDCASFSRTGIDDIKKIAVSFDNLLIIDHHLEEEGNRQENCVCIVDSKASSTAILIYTLLKELNIEITKDIAYCLLCGIFTDTGGFQHDNTDMQTLRIAADLLRKGSRIDKIARSLLGGKSMPAIKLWGKVLRRIQTDEKTGMALSYISKKDIEECGAKQEDIAGLAGIINTASNAKFSLLLTEFDNHRIKCSLRSEEYKGVDVSKIARSFGGGGHKLASGFEIDGDIKNSISKIKEMILEKKKKGEL